MPRRPRMATGNFIYHVMNRRAGSATLFHSDADFAAFQRVLEEARGRVAMRLLAYCVMPNHWHLIVWPQQDGDLSEYMRWLTLTHTQRWHAAHGTVGTGALYQGRFKSFPVQEGEHFYAVCRHVERNAIRANLVQKAEDWPWCSLWAWLHNTVDVSLYPWPLPRPSDWARIVDQPQDKAELHALHGSLQRGTPLGSPEWTEHTARLLGLESTLRPRGRPRGKSKGSGAFSRRDERFDSSG